MEIYDNDKDDNDSDGGIVVDEEDEVEESMAEVRGEKSSSGGVGT